MGESTLARRQVGSVRHERSATREEAEASILPSIEVPANRVRRHSTLEYMTPDEFERTNTPDIR